MVPTKHWKKTLRKSAIATGRTVFSVVLFLMQRDASLLGAGLAFFAMISLAPFVVLAVAIAGLLLGAKEAQAELHARLSEEVNPDVADFISTLAQQSDSAGMSLSWVTLMGSFVLLWSSARLFIEVRRALHSMWEIPAPPEISIREAILGFFKTRVVAAFGTVIFGGILIAVLGSRAALNALFDDWRYDGWWAGVWYLIEPGVTLLVVACLIWLVFKILPDQSPKGWPLRIGALGTAAMVLLGRQMVGVYVNAGGIDTAYGAAGSAVVFLIWAYWSSLAFLFGARLAWSLDALWDKARDVEAIEAANTRTLRSD